MPFLIFPLLWICFVELWLKAWLLQTTVLFAPQDESVASSDSLVSYLTQDTDSKAPRTDHAAPGRARRRAPEAICALLETANITVQSLAVYRDRPEEHHSCAFP